MSAIYLILLYTANIASVGAASSPVPSSMKIGTLNDVSGCCVKGCLSGLDKHIQLIKEATKHYNFLQAKYPNKNYCKMYRTKHQVLTSLDEDLTSYDKFLQ